MPNDFENTIAEFIAANGLFGQGGMARSAAWPCILVAVSGGADSMALMYALYSLNTAGILKSDLTVAHINHQLRGTAADEDEAFVIQQADIFDLPVITRRVAVAEFAAAKKLSIETAARQLRMAALFSMAKENGCLYIAVAHHKNDNAETIVHRLLRGTGYRGLAGIRPAKKFDNGITFVRPLLCVSREQIVKYLNELKIPWRHDQTNDDPAFTRNFIRHNLLPQLQRQSRDPFVELLDRLSCECRKFADLLDRQVDNLWPHLVVKKADELIELDPKVFASMPTSLKPEITRRALLAVGSGERDLTQEHYERIIHFAEAGKTNKSLTLPHGFVVRAGKTLAFEKQHVVKPAPQGLAWKIETQMFDAKACDIEKFKSQKTQYIEWFDADKVVGTPAIRPRKDGDVFWPIGLAAPKKVGKFLTDAHIDRELRRLVYVVEDNEKIIWLMPIRASERTKVTSSAKRILQITCSPQEAATQ